MIVLKYQQEIAYLDTAFLTVSVCEALGSLSTERRLIWKGSRNASQVLYLLARYACIISFLIFLMGDAPQSKILNNGSFYNGQGLTHWLLNINLLFVEVIFMLRTWALWERSRGMAIFLSILFVLLWGSTFGLLILALSSFSSLTYVYVVSWTVFYLVIMILVVVKVTKMKKNGHSTSFIRLVHNQGLAYYTILFGLSGSALIVSLVSPDVVTIVVRIIQVTFTHMACRMTLSLRKQGARTVIGLDSNGVVQSSELEEQTAMPLSALNFGSRTVPESDVVSTTRRSDVV